MLLIFRAMSRNFHLCKRDAEWHVASELHLGLARTCCLPLEEEEKRNVVVFVSVFFSADCQKQTW